jgi:protoporphyrinogen oxidase
MQRPDNRSYNSSFIYPRGGAIEFINALLRDLPQDTVSLSERLEAIDLSRRVATTSRREIGFEQLISSAPFPRLCEMTRLEHDRAAFSWNKVLVFNLGFDSKGRDDVHWMYFPQRDLRFYRVGFYDNIMGTDRMSLYVEIGAEHAASFDVAAEKRRVLEDLRKVGILGEQKLVSWHHVALDPAYVHITGRSIAEVDRRREELQQAGVHSVGRYGGWTYCSIEDNIVETRALAAELA